MNVTNPRYSQVHRDYVVTAAKSFGFHQVPTKDQCDQVLKSVFYDEEDKDPETLGPDICFGGSSKRFSLSDSYQKSALYKMLKDILIKD